MLLFLSLLAVASASPLHLLNHQYAYNPYYSYNPYVQQYPVQYPVQYPMQYPVHYQQVHKMDPAMNGDTRTLLTTSLIMNEKATFEASTAVAAVAAVSAVAAVAASAAGVTPVVTAVAAVAAVDAVLAQSAKTLTGTARLDQNPLMFNRAKYSVYLANAAASTKLKLGVASACDDASAAAGVQLAEITTPILLLNGVWITGVTSMYNLNGAGTGTDITGMVLTVTEGTSVVGCSSAIA